MSERAEGEQGLSDQNLRRLSYGPVRELSDRDLTRLMDGDQFVRDRLRKMEKWDDRYPDGEGKVPTGKPFHSYDFHEYVQWVRVTKGRENRRVVATFLLWWRNGEPWRMGIAVARKRLPPNPYEYRRLSMFDWSKVDDVSRENPTAAESEYRAEVEESSGSPLTDDEWIAVRERNSDRALATEQSQSGAGWWGMTGTPGAQPTIEVYPIPTRGGEPRWRFPEDGGASFKVRGSLLAQALFTLRMSGQQRVSVHTLRETVSRIQQG